MTLRKAHGNGAKALVRAETMPADELPLGVPESADGASRTAAAETGKFAPGNRRSVLGGRARAGKVRIAERLGLASLPVDSAFSTYKRHAAAFRRAQCTELARTVGGGVCGPGPSSIVASAALLLAWSRYFSDQAAAKSDPEFVTRAARLADQSRSALLTAHELCAREAEARKRATGPMDLRARILGAAADLDDDDDEDEENSGATNEGEKTEATDGRT